MITLLWQHGKQFITHPSWKSRIQLCLLRIWSPWHEEAEKSTGISSKHTSSTTSSSAIHTIQQEGTHKGEKVDADEEEKEEEEEIDQSLPEEVRRAIAKALPFYREMYACRMRVGCEP